MVRRDSSIIVISKLSPAIVTLQETKLYKKGKLKKEDYKVFESLRNNAEGGGLATIIHEKLNPIEICKVNESKMSENILVTEADIGKERICIINAYCPQKYAKLDEKIEFYTNLDEEIQAALDSGNLVCVQLDGNGKFGSSIIREDPHEMSNNGKLLLDLITRKNLILVNSSNECKGTITRSKVVGGHTEKSVIDFFFVCERLFQYVDYLEIDEERKYCFKKYSRTKGNIKVIESDHNLMLLNLKFNFNKRIFKNRLKYLI